MFMEWGDSLYGIDWVRNRKQLIKQSNKIIIGNVKYISHFTFIQDGKHCRYNIYISGVFIILWRGGRYVLAKNILLLLRKGNGLLSICHIHKNDFTIY